MKSKKIKLTTLILLGLGFTGTYAQQANASSGGNASGSGGSVSYSIGQAVYTTNTASNGSVAQGVQQAYEIYVYTEVDDSHIININLSAYPNPTKDVLNLKVDNYEEGKLLYQLFDTNGKLLEDKKIDTLETNITMNHLPSAIYFLKVAQDNKIVKSFKIIKN